MPATRPPDDSPPGAGPSRPPAVRAPRRLKRKVFVVLLLLLGVCAVPFARFALQVRTFTERRATGPAWSFPSRVWSDALVLEGGRALPERYLREHLELRGYRQVGAPKRPGEWASAPGGALLVLRGFPVPFDPPALHRVGSPRGPERVRLRLAAGRISEVQRLGALPGYPPPDSLHAPSLEPVLIATVADSDRVYREWVPLARIPRALRLAVIASEDRRFRQHFGLDLKGNFRALATNLRAGSVRQGASTITQQLARGLFLGTERTMGRKLQEMAIAVGLELLLSKEQILEMYLNSVYLGRMGPMGGAGTRGIAGVGEASWRMFGVPVDSLTLAQCATLVGTIPAPNLYSPLRRPDHALRRRSSVLHDMLETGVLDSTLAHKAAAKPLGVRPTPAPEDRFASSVSAVKQELSEQLSRDALEHWGLDVFTSIDPVWQVRAERELTRGVQGQEVWRGRASEPLQGAFVLLDAPSGEVRAIVGGRSDHPSQFNRVTQAHRQPGSAIKAVVYAAALDPRRGNPRFTPGSTVSDLRQEFDTPEGPWKPRNDEGDYHETVTLAKALAKSLNLATADLVQRIGPGTVSRYAERFGLGRPEAVASIGLGTHEVTPLALAGAYTVFANTGWRREPRIVRAVRDAMGHALPLRARPRLEVLPEPTAALTRGMLEDVVIFGIAYPLRAQYGFTRPCGGKTGTTNEYRDAWFVGFTPDLAAAVWVGYDTPASLSRAASKVALPVWAGVMNAVLDGFPVTDFPARKDIVLAWVDPYTGGLARSDCPSPLRVPFLLGSAPKAFCTRDHTADWAALRAGQFADSLSRARADSTARVDSLSARANEAR